MKSDNDKISNKEREIDEFLSKFEALDSDDTSQASANVGDASSDKGSKRNKKNKSKTKGSKNHRGSFLARLIKGNGEPLKDRLFLKENPYYNKSLGASVVINGKKVKNTPKVISKGKIAKDLIILFAILFVIAILYTFVVISTAPKIDPENIYDSVAQSSVIYDDQDKKVSTVFYNQDRQLISL